MRLGCCSIVDVLDHGRVELRRYMADDIYVVEAAKASFNQEVVEFGEHERGVLRFMMKKSHGTPFEHQVFTFVVKCPMFVAREWFRHRISSFNEWSARYSVLDPEFYIAENVRGQVGKPGAYTFEPIGGWRKRLYRWLIFGSGRLTYSLYSLFMKVGIAKELARAVLPVNIYTRFYWTVNARALMNFLRLRNAPDAQWEIGEFAKAIEAMFAEVMPETHQAFVDYGRIVP